MLINFFPTENIFPPRFSIVISARIVSVTKLANIKIIWSKLETKEQSNKMLIYWSVPGCLVTPGTESLTRHIDLLDAVTHTHLRLANLAKHKPVSTFSFSHLQNFHLFFKNASISDTSGFSPFASTIWKDEIYDQVVGSLSGQVFQSGCHQFASSRNIVNTHTTWPPNLLQSLNGWLASDNWVTSLRCRRRTVTQHVLSDSRHLRTCRVRMRSKRKASLQNLTRKISHMLNIPYNFLNGFELISKRPVGPLNRRKNPMSATTHPHLSKCTRQFISNMILRCQSQTILVSL